MSHLRIKVFLLGNSHQWMWKSKEKILGREQQVICPWILISVIRRNKEVKEVTLRRLTVTVSPTRRPRPGARPQLLEHRTGQPGMVWAGAPKDQLTLGSTRSQCLSYSYNPCSFYIYFLLFSFKM